MKHNKYELTYKKFIKARKRLDELRYEMRNQPWRKLEQPYQDGWKLSVVLREDYMRSEAGPIVKTILDKFAEKGYVKNPKLISEIRKTPTLIKARSIFINKHGIYFNYYGPGIRWITEKEFNQLSIHQKKYFRAIPAWQKATQGGVKADYELDVPMHYLLIKVDKYMIGQVQDINPILLKEEAELEKILAPYWRTLSYGKGYYHYFERRKERRAAKVELTKLEIE